MTRRIRDVLFSIAALAGLIAILAMIDGRVRERLTEFAPEGIWDHVTAERGQLASAGTKAYGVVVDHGRLAAFVVAGSALVACMLRT